MSVNIKLIEVSVFLFYYFCTLLRVWALIPGLLLMTLETVLADTPACFAMSYIVIFPLLFL